MKKTILFSIFFSVITFTATSQTKQESIKQLIHLMRTDSMMEKTFNAIVPTLMAQFPEECQDSTKSASLNQFSNSMIASGKVIFNKMLNEDIVGLYDKFYTENEINDLITFYRTPTGQKIIKTTPEMQKEIMLLVMKKFMPEMKKNIQEMALKTKSEAKK